MKKIALEILDKYLEIFPDEKERQKQLSEYLAIHSDSEITDWNNFDGHIVATGILYAKKENKFLVLFHKDLQLYLFPGGHSDPTDLSPLETSIRETKEETGLTNFDEVLLFNNKLIPIDIDTHIIEYNKNRNLPEHYHFDFRYLFSIEQIADIKIDEEESANFKWISIDEAKSNPRYLTVIEKIKKLKT